MIHMRRVSGSSMQPTLRGGDVVVAVKRKPRVGSVVLARIGELEVIKRVGRMEHDSCYLTGDNGHESTDSRHYGKVPTHDILGTIMMTLPKAVNPPKLVKPYGVWLGRIAALILVGMVLAQLYRIDTFLPIVDQYVPGGSVAASLFGVAVIMSELFALPFVLRMKVSPLAHVVSGALVVFAPLWWVLAGIWTFGMYETTGQLGKFVTVPSTIAVLFLNIVWLAFSYYVLYTLGYNTLSLRRALRK